MTKIVFLDRSTIGPAVSITKPSFDHEWVEYDRSTADEVVEKLSGAPIAITNKVPIRKEHLDQLPDLKMIGIAATGYDVVDVAECQKRGIIVSNVRGYAVNTVPEHVFALVLALRRGIVGFRQDVIDGEWQKAAQFCFFNHPINDLANSTIGIVGEGMIGQNVARIARGFGMNILFAAHKGVEGLGPLYTPWDQVIEESDIITCHAPLMPATKHMIAMPELKRMKKTALLINCGRGGLVHEEDLVQAIEEGEIAGAGFDCLTSEPPVPGHPFEKIYGRPNVIVTPHVAWASNEAMQTLWDQVIEHVENFKAGSPSNVIGA